MQKEGEVDSKAKEEVNWPFGNYPCCWHCGHAVYMLDDGWICKGCSQHGPCLEVQCTWIDAVNKNAPYWWKVK